MLPVFASSDCFALKAHHQSGYLQCVRHDGRGRLESSAPSVAGNPRARFFLEPSSEEDDGLVHIRNCYNNKYWVLTENSTYISDADVPDEDPSGEEPSRTLFQLVTVGSMGNAIRLYVPRYQEYVSMMEACLRCTPLDSEIENFTVIGLSRRNELPKYVAFKGDNGKYLRYQDTWLRFDANEKGAQGVICTVHTNDDGTVQIKSNNGGYWRRRSDYDDWIDAVKGAPDADNPNMSFKVMRDDKGKIALENMGNHKFCNRLDYKKDGVSYLSATENNLSGWARFEVEDPTSKREISDVEFHLDEARIYNNTLVLLDEDQRTNRTSSVQTGSFTFSERTGVVISMGTTVSSRTASGQGTSIKIAKGPVVIGGEVKLTSIAESSQVEAGSVDVSVETHRKQDFIVHPGQTVTAKFVASKACCDVPYSYKERILMPNGEIIVTEHKDGIYSSVNKTNFEITMDPF